MNKIHHGRIFTCDFISWDKSVPELLDRTGLAARLSQEKLILIKPNLVEALAPPITTPVELVAGLIAYLQKKAPQARILIGEGSGALDYDTFHSFEVLGYATMAEQLGVQLLDLNEAALTRKTNHRCRRWPEIYLPEIAFDSFLISVPVLKAHSLAGVTLGMKNLMGLAPPTHYQQGGHWKKAAFHDNIQAAILDLNRYRSADFTLLDATVGMQEAHLWGPTCEPPPNQLAAAHDPVALDAFGAGLLKKKWQEIGHIAGAHGELGRAEPLIIDNMIYEAG